MRTMPKIPERLKVSFQGTLNRVDREKNIIFGYTVAQAGPFKSQGRGEFDQDSLARIMELMNQTPAGVKSRFTHPDLSADGLGKFLGRSKDARIDGDKVRADLHLSPTSFSTPSGNLGGYVMDLAESDPAAFGSSLVLQTEKTYRIDEKGKPLLDAEGEELPPLWMPTKIFASDVVDEGDAVHDGFLTANGVLLSELPDEALWEGAAILDRLFAGQSREVVEERCRGFLERYLERRYGGQPKPDLSTLKRRLKLRSHNWSVQ